MVGTTNPGHHYTSNIHRNCSMSVAVVVISFHDTGGAWDREEAFHPQYGIRSVGRSGVKFHDG